MTIADALGLITRAGDSYPPDAYFKWNLSSGETVGKVGGFQVSASSISGMEFAGQAKQAGFVGQAYLVAKNESAAENGYVEVETTGNFNIDLRSGTATGAGGKATYIKTNDALANAANKVLYLDVQTSGTAAAGLGTGFAVRIEDASGNLTEAGDLVHTWISPTDGSERSRWYAKHMELGTQYQLPLHNHYAERQNAVITDCYNDSRLGGDGMASSAIGAGTVAAIASEASHPGIINFTQSGANTGGWIGITGLTSVALAGGEVFECIFRMNSVTNTVYRLGFQDSITTTLPTDGCYIHIAGTTADGRSYSNTTNTTTGTTYTVSAATWYRAKVFVSATNLATFTIYNMAGAVLWSDTVATNIPNGAGRETSMFVLGYKTTAGTVSLADFDWVSYTNLTALTR